MTSTAFLTDKYEITMVQAMLESGRAHDRAVFDLFARRLAEGRHYGVVGGVLSRISTSLTSRLITRVTNLSSLSCSGRSIERHV